MVWEPPTIRVHVPAVACEARDCELPQRYEMLWHDQPNGRLEHFLICGFHLWALKDRGGPAVFGPIGSLPAVQSVAAMLRERMAPRPQQVFMTMGFGGTGSYGNFGTIHWG